MQIVNVLPDQWGDRITTGKQARTFPRQHFSNDFQHVIGKNVAEMDNEGHRKSFVSSFCLQLQNTIITGRRNQTINKTIRFIHAVQGYSIFRGQLSVGGSSSEAERDRVEIHSEQLEGLRDLAALC